MLLVRSLKIPKSEFLNQNPLIAARLAALSPAAFAQTKAQLRAEARERVERNSPATDKIATDIWAAISA